MEHHQGAESPSSSMLKGFRAGLSVFLTALSPVSRARALLGLQQQQQQQRSDALSQAEQLAVPSALQHSDHAGQPVQQPPTQQQHPLHQDEADGLGLPDGPLKCRPGLDVQ
jgi:hypothetical protein